MKVENELSSGVDETPPRDSILHSFLRTIARRPRMLDAEDPKLRFSQDVGLTAFLLKFGEGMEEVKDIHILISACTIGISYFIGGL